MKNYFSEQLCERVRAIKDRHLKGRIADLIEEVERADHLSAIPNIKKLHSADDYYRIRLGEYRFGLIVRGTTVLFVRFLHRKEIYRYFP